MFLTYLLLKFWPNDQNKRIPLLTDLMGILTNQSAQLLEWKRKTKFKNSLNKFSFVLLIVIWSQSASILTKTFTGLLLNIYFNQMTPIVETLEDIYSNKEISIASISYIFKEYSRRIDVSNELKRDILTRIIEYDEKIKYSEPNVDYFSENLSRVN